MLVYFFPVLSFVYQVLNKVHFLLNLPFFEDCLYLPQLEVVIRHLLSDTINISNRVVGVEKHKVGRILVEKGLVRLNQVLEFDLYTMTNCEGQLT